MNRLDKFCDLADRLATALRNEYECVRVQGFVEMCEDVIDCSGLIKGREVIDAAAGINDCLAGVYDKHYRYNHQDDGAAYDTGWRYQNAKTQNDTVRFIECEGK